MAETLTPELRAFAAELARRCAATAIRMGRPGHTFSIVEQAISKWLAEPAPSSPPGTVDAATYEAAVNGRREFRQALRDTCAERDGILAISRARLKRIIRLEGVLRRIADDARSGQCEVDVIAEAAAVLAEPAAEITARMAELERAAAEPAPSSPHEVITRMARDLVTEFGRLLNDYKGADPASVKAVREFLWDNKVGLLRIVEHCATPDAEAVMDATRGVPDEAQLRADIARLRASFPEMELTMSVIERLEIERNAAHSAGFAAGVEAAAKCVHGITTGVQHDGVYMAGFYSAIGIAYHRVSAIAPPAPPSGGDALHYEPSEEARRDIEAIERRIIR